MSQCAHRAMGPLRGAIARAEDPVGSTQVLGCSLMGQVCQFPKIPVECPIWGEAKEERLVEGAG